MTRNKETTTDALPVVVDNQAVAPLITPDSLLDAVRSQDVKRVKAILSRDEDCSSRTTEGLSTLHYCAFHNDAEMVELLLGHGADVNAKDNQLRSPFMLAVACSALEVAGVFRVMGVRLTMQLGCSLRQFLEYKSGRYHKSTWSASSRILAWRNRVH